ncbi:MAG: sulfatase-like hydrolase/transferase [Bacteroidota bacterium]
MRRGLLMAVGVCVAMGAGCAGPPVDPRPNVIVVLVDDMGYSDLGITGGDIQTPTLDRLAVEGVFMTQFYNNAKCSPSRAALMTGRHPHEAGMGSAIWGLNRDPRPAGPYQGYLRTDVPTVAELLRAEGYATMLSGKWHLGEREPHWPRQRGFDRYFGLIGGASSYYELITDQPRVRVMANDDAPWTPPGAGFYMTDAFADSAAAFIAQHTDTSDAPFFLYLSFTAPHWPLHAPEDAIRAYDGAYDDGWEALHAARSAELEDRQLVPDGLTPAPLPTSLPVWDTLTPDEQATWARRMAVHAAMMTRMDAALGRVLDQVGATGEASNTLVLFASDNGASAEDVAGRGLNDPSVPIGAMGSYDAFREPWAWASVAPFHRYKLNLDEGGIRTPLIAHWPDGLGPGGQRLDTPGHLIDLVPTILAAAGATPEAAFSGVSLLDHWRGGKLAARPLYWEYDGHRAIRQGSMKALYREDEGTWSLYDLASDPAEQQDLAADRPDTLSTLTVAWDAWAADVGVDVSR